MSLTASRMDRIEPSASSVATQRARELAAQGHDIITLTQGQPDFPTPDHVIEAAHAAMKRGETSYTFASYERLKKNEKIEAIQSKIANH